MNSALFLVKMNGLLFQNFHAQPASVHSPKFLGHFYLIDFLKNFLE